MFMIPDWILQASISHVLFAFVIIVFVKVVLNVVLDNLRLPPGPWGVPVLGYLPWLSGAPHRRLRTLATQYGPLMSLRLGSQLLVCVSSAKLVRELFRRPELTGRPNTPLVQLMGGYGIIMSEGQLWKAQRQFLHEKFRNLGATFMGSGENNIDNLIMIEVEELLSTLSRRQGEIVDPDPLLGRHVHNVICQLMMGLRFEEGDQRFLEFNRRISEGMHLYGQVHIGEYVPAYLSLPGKRAVLDKLNVHHRKTSSFSAEMVRARRDQGDVAEPPRDLLDCYLLEMGKAKLSGVKSDIFAGSNEEEQLVQVMNDLFSAGMETVKSTLLWTLALLVRWPGVAERVRREIAGVVGAGARVRLSDRPALRYCEATLLESMRLITVVPLGTPHRLTRKCEVDGYTIPAGSQVIALIDKIHLDPEAWVDPEQFRPERFLDESGQLNRPDHFMPFGVGRRMCLGDSLARMELFLFFTNLLHNFVFRVPQGNDLPPLDGVLGATHAPCPYRLQFEKITFEKTRNTGTF